MKQPLLAEKIKTLSHPVGHLVDDAFKLNFVVYEVILLHLSNDESPRLRLDFLSVNVVSQLQKVFRLANRLHVHLLHKFELAVCQVETQLVE